MCWNVWSVHVSIGSAHLHHSLVLVFIYEFRIGGLVGIKGMRSEAFFAYISSENYGKCNFVFNGHQMDDDWLIGMIPLLVVAVITPCAFLKAPFFH